MLICTSKKLNNNNKRNSTISMRYTNRHIIVKVLKDKENLEVSKRKMTHHTQRNSSKINS